MNKPRMAHRIQRPNVYVPAVATDIRKTFARVRREIGDGIVTERLRLHASGNVARMVVTQ